MQFQRLGRELRRKRGALHAGHGLAGLHRALLLLHLEALVRLGHRGAQVVEATLELLALERRHRLAGAHRAAAAHHFLDGHLATERLELQPHVVGA